MAAKVSRCCSSISARLSRNATSARRFGALAAGGLSTHAGSLALAAEYVCRRRRRGVAVRILGIQPADVSPGEGLSEQVARGVERLARAVRRHRPA
jgi:hypothetical protein